MKKVLFVAAALLAGSAVFSVSYKNNTYQKLADEYTKKAQNALDAGEYELSVEYSQKAEENAALSQAYIKKMLAKAEADKAMKKASDRIAFAKKISADRNFPMAYSAAEQAYAHNWCLLPQLQLSLITRKNEKEKKQSKRKSSNEHKCRSL